MSKLLPTPALLAIAVALIPACVDGGHIECGSPPVWETVDAVVVSVDGVRQTDDQPAGDITIETEAGAERVIAVWGNPSGLEVGSTYRFEITQNDESFFGYRGEPACYPEEFRQAAELEG